MINLRSHAGGKHRLTVARCQTVRSLFVVDGDGELAVRQSLRRTGQHDGQSAHEDTDNNLSFQHESSLEPSPISVESNILTSDKPYYLPSPLSVRITLILRNLATYTGPIRAGARGRGTSN